MRDKLDKLIPLLLCLAATLGCNLSNPGGGGDRDRRESGSSSRSTGEGGLAEASWTGMVQCDDGDEMEAKYRIAASGNPIYEYQSKSGPREVELTEPGQMIRFVPPGGGVTTVVVDSISATPERISYSMSISDESSGGGTLSQSRATMQSEATPAGSDLQVEFTIRSQNVLSQPGIVVPGDESAVVCRGKLRK